MGKGEVNVVLVVIIGIVIAVILLLATWKYPEALLKILTGNPNENIHSEQQFAVLVDKIKIIDEGKRYEQLFGVGEGYWVVGFFRDKKKIDAGKCYEIGGDKLYIELKNDIVKPKEQCEKEACLCLCKGDEKEGVCGSKEDALCYGLNFDVKDVGNTCGDFIVRGYDFGVLYMKKEKGALVLTRQKGLI